MLDNDEVHIVLHPANTESPLNAQAALTGEISIEDHQQRMAAVVESAFAAKVARQGKIDDGLSQLNPSPAPVSDVVRRGQEAMARKRRAYDDWLAIAEVMRELHTNEPRGRRYEKAIGAWLAENGFQEIDKGTRNRLLECLKHQVEIETWRQRLTDSERFAFNHPDTVLHKWKASTAVPDPNQPPRLTPMQELHIELAAVIDDRDRLGREVALGGGDLWVPEDRARDIAKVIVAKLTSAKAAKVAHEILAALKEASK